MGNLVKFHSCEELYGISPLGKGLLSRFVGPAGVSARRLRCQVLIALMPLVVLLASCADFPGGGPSRRGVQEVEGTNEARSVVQVVDIDDAVAQRLLGREERDSFAESLGQVGTSANSIGAGDAIEITLWEAPPATLFSAGVDARGGLSTTRFTTLPEQLVDQDGYVVVPFVGRVMALGQTPQALGDEIVRRLRGQANRPEALVKITKSTSTSVTVMGEVANGMRLPLSRSGERVLDALAAAGGVRQPVNKVMVQLTRGGGYYAMPLDRVIRDPRQNVTLKPGDVITAISQPFSFTVLGAASRNEEVNFEAQGISLAQALARAGGLLDNRADARGAFIFRFESPEAQDWPMPAMVVPGQPVPVVYRINLADPRSFFVMQRFAMHDKDVVYVSNAPAAELQKFLNIVFSGIYPILSTIQTTR